PLDGLPGLRRVVVQQLVGDDLVQGDVQPRADLLTCDDHFLIVAEGVFEFRVQCLEQEDAVILVGWIQPFQVQALVAAVPGGHRPRPAVTRRWLVEPALRCLPGPRQPDTAGRTDDAPRDGAACRSRGLLAAPAAARWAPSASRTHAPIVPEPRTATSVTSDRGTGCTARAAMLLCPGGRVGSSSAQDPRR